MLRDCALLVAVPLSRSDFERGLGGRDSTFVRVFAARRLMLTPGALWGLYRPYAQFASEVIAEAAGMNVEVRTQATLEDFRACCRTAAVVTIVAHWRSAGFTADDLVEPAALAAALGLPAQTSIDATAVAERLNEVPGGPETGSDGLARARQLVHREYALWARRKWLEALVPGAVRGGPAVEFAEGFQPVSEVIAAMDPGVSAIIDLTVCNSVLLGEEIRRMCPNCVVLMNAAPATLDFRFALYRQIIRLMRRRGWSYQRAAMRLRSYLTEARA